MIRAMPNTTVREDGSCLIVFTGPANRHVTWTMSGTGTLSILSEFTDASGVALARYNPGSAGDQPTITVTYTE